MHWCIRRLGVLDAPQLQQVKSRKKQSINIKRDEINTTNINNGIFNRHNSFEIIIIGI